MIGIDAASGSQRVLRSGVEHLSLPAVAGHDAAVLRRDRNGEQLLLVPLAGGAPRVLASRAGAPLWGAGKIADGRPVAYDGERVVFTARRSVLAVTPPAP